MTCASARSLCELSQALDDGDGFVSLTAPSARGVRSMAARQQARAGVVKISTT
jgi:hypothetical protein